LAVEHFHRSIKGMCIPSEWKKVFWQSCLAARTFHGPFPDFI
jgi:hypothetical protein